MTKKLLFSIITLTKYENHFSIKMLFWIVTLQDIVYLLYIKVNVIIEYSLETCKMNTYKFNFVMVIRQEEEILWFWNCWWSHQNSCSCWLSLRKETTKETTVAFWGRSSDRSFQSLLEHIVRSRLDSSIHWCSKY